MVDLSKFTFNKKILNNFVTKLCSIISFHEFFTYIRHQRWIQCFLKKKDGSNGLIFFCLGLVHIMK